MCVDYGSYLERHRNKKKNTCKLCTSTGNVSLVIAWCVLWSSKHTLSRWWIWLQLEIKLNQHRCLSFVNLAWVIYSQINVKLNKHKSATFTTSISRFYLTNYKQVKVKETNTNIIKTSTANNFMLLLLLLEYCQRTCQRKRTSLEALFQLVLTRNLIEVTFTSF